MGPWRSIPHTKGGVICKYCGLVMRSGGITRLKHHLAGVDPGKNVKACDQVPPQVKEEIRNALLNFTINKEKRWRPM